MNFLSRWFADSPQAQSASEPDNPAILIVDDDPINRTLLGRLCARAELASIEVASGSEALSILESQQIEMVLLDVSMPGMDGFEVLHRIRESHDEVNLPVIMVTADDNRDRIIKAVEAGANDYITKPVDSGVMLAKLQNYMRLKRTQLALKESEERYALAARATNDGIWDWNLDSGKIYFSPRWQELLGLPPVETVSGSEHWFSRIPAEDLSRVECSLRDHLAGQTDHFETEFRMQHSDGQQRWMLARGMAIGGTNGQPYRVAGSLTDVTRAKVADPLTGLPNRHLLEQRIGRALAQYQSDPVNQFAIMFLNIDDFKGVNATLGNELGDRMLTAVANRLDHSVSRGDSLVARLCEDQFAVLIENLRSESHVHGLAKRIIEKLSLPVSIGIGTDVRCSVSVGLTMASPRSLCVGDLMREARVALAEAKLSGKRGYRMFNHAMLQRVDRASRQKEHVQTAIRNRDLELRFTPILNMQADCVELLSANLFWRDPQVDRALPLSPELVDAAHQMELGAWFADQVCAQARHWQDEHDLSNLKVGIPVTHGYLIGHDFAGSLMRSIEKHRLAAQQVAIEVSEDLIGTTVVDALARFQQLRSEGISVALTGFGTGGTSLCSLHQLPIDMVKIHHELTDRMFENEDEQVVLQAILAMAEGLRLKCVATAVGSSSQVRKLVELGCCFGQGDFLAPMLEADEAVALVKQIEQRPIQNLFPKSATHPAN